jgi:outer membrane protein
MQRHCVPTHCDAVGDDVIVSGIRRDKDWVMKRRGKALTKTGLAKTGLAGAGALILLGLSTGVPARAQSQRPPPTSPLSTAPLFTPPPVKARPARSGTPLIGVPHTLSEALAATYSYQPALQAERAKLRAADENVPQALAGWRPTVIMSGELGYGDGLSRAYSFISNTNTKAPLERDLGEASATISQPIYTGGKVQATVNKAKNSDMAERANLIVQEEQSFTDTVTAYVGVIESQELLALNVNNEQVLTRQLQATNDRFRVGEITRTDVAQAEAALAGAVAQREIAEGNLQTSRATYLKVIGFQAADDLKEPQPLRLSAKNEQEIAALATANNPVVIGALFTNAAAKDAIEVAFAALMPQVSLQGQIFQQNNTGSRSAVSNGYLVTADLSVPLYQGGSEYSAVRQARQSQQQSSKQVEDAKRTAVQTAVSAWETLIAARASAESTRSQIRANEIALEGVEREAIVGSRTTLDVLNAQQALLTSQTTLVQALSQLITASYAVASAIGRLTARDLNLPVPLYDDTAYYNAVKNKWFGLGDYATDQPGR